MVRIAQHLERAKGCITDVNDYRALVAQLQAQNTLLKLSTDLTEEIVEEVQEAVEVRQQLTKAQRTAQWFRNRWKDFVAFILGAIAATEAAFIVYQTVTK